MFKIHYKRSWFTLAELLVTMVILVILTAIGFLMIQQYLKDAEIAAMKTDVRLIWTSISVESTATNSSPRHYVVHDPAVSQEGHTAYVAGIPTTLIGGSPTQPWTNYSAGYPDWTKLRLEPKPVLIWAVDIPAPPTVSGWTRISNFIQTAAVSPKTNVVVLEGDLPLPTPSQRETLIPKVGEPTGYYVGGNPILDDEGNPIVDGEGNPIEDEPRRFVLDDGFTWGVLGLHGVPLEESTLPWGVTSLLVSPDGEPLVDWAVLNPSSPIPRAPALSGCDSPDIYVPKAWLIWSACNVGASTAYRGQALSHDCALDENGYVDDTVDCYANSRHILGNYYQWGRNFPTIGTQNVMESHSPGSQPTHSGFIISNEATWWYVDWLSSPFDDVWWGSGMTARSWTYAESGGGLHRMQGPCPAGYHVPTAREWSLTAAALSSEDENPDDPHQHWYMATNREDPEAFWSYGMVEALRIPEAWGTRFAYPWSPAIFADQLSTARYATSSSEADSVFFAADTRPNIAANSSFGRASGMFVRCVRNMVSTVLPACGEAVEWAWGSYLYYLSPVELSWTRKPDYALCKSGYPTEVVADWVWWTWKCNGRLGSQPNQTNGVICRVRR